MAVNRKIFSKEKELFWRDFISFYSDAFGPTVIEAQARSPKHASRTSWREWTNNSSAMYAVFSFYLFAPCDLQTPRL